jgi:hypothetical protein
MPKHVFLAALAIPLLSLFLIRSELRRSQHQKIGKASIPHVPVNHTAPGTESKFVQLNVITDSLRLYLPFVTKPRPNEQWFIECVDCPASFWRMTDNSLRLDSNDYPHVVYGGNRLFYAWFDGTSWSNETIDVTPQSGYSPALVIDSYDNPHVVYVVVNNSIPPYNNNQVRYATRTVNGWTIETIESSLDYLAEASIALDSAERIHIGYFDSTTGAYNHTVWSNDHWDTEEIPFGGKETTLLLDANNILHLVYCDGTLVYAHRNGGSWNTHDLGSCVYHSMNVSAALDQAGLPHISYYNANGDLTYAHWNGTTWSTDPVDVGVYLNYPSWEMSTSLALDSANAPHISYTVDSSPQGLKYAFWTGSSWDVMRLYTGGEKMCGQSSLALNDNGQPRIACHDLNERGLLYIRKGLQ